MGPTNIVIPRSSNNEYHNDPIVTECLQNADIRLRTAIMTVLLPVDTTTNKIELVSEHNEGLVDVSTTTMSSLPSSESHRVDDQDDDDQDDDMAAAAFFASQARKRQEEFRLPVEEWAAVIGPRISVWSSRQQQQQQQQQQPRSVDAVLTPHDHVDIDQVAKELYRDYKRILHTT